MWGDLCGYFKKSSVSRLSFRADIQTWEILFISLFWSKILHEEAAVWVCLEAASDFGPSSLSNPPVTYDLKVYRSLLR